MRASRPFSITSNKVLSDPKVASLYLEECLKDGDMDLFTAALKDVAEARGGIGLLAKETDLNRESLYRTLSRKGNPRLDTLTKILAAMDLRLGFMPVNTRS